MDIDEKIGENSSSCCNDDNNPDSHRSNINNTPLTPRLDENRNEKRRHRHRSSSDKKCVKDFCTKSPKSPDQQLLRSLNLRPFADFFDSSDFDEDIAEIIDSCGKDGEAEEDDDADEFDIETFITDFKRNYADDLTPILREIGQIWSSMSTSSARRSAMITAIRATFVNVLSTIRRKQYAMLEAQFRKRVHSVNRLRRSLQLEPYRFEQQQQQQQQTSTVATKATIFAANREIRAAYDEMKHERSRRLTRLASLERQLFALSTNLDEQQPLLLMAQELSIIATPDRIPTDKEIDRIDRLVESRRESLESRRAQYDSLLRETIEWLSQLGDYDSETPLLQPLLFLRIDQEALSILSDRSPYTPKAWRIVNDLHRRVGEMFRDSIAICAEFERKLSQHFYRLDIDAAMCERFFAMLADHDNDDNGVRRQRQRRSLFVKRHILSAQISAIVEIRATCANRADFRRRIIANIEYLLQNGIDEKAYCGRGRGGGGGGSGDGQNSDSIRNRRRASLASYSKVMKDFCVSSTHSPLSLVKSFFSSSSSSSSSSKAHDDDSSGDESMIVSVAEEVKADDQKETTDCDSSSSSSCATFPAESSLQQPEKLSSKLYLATTTTTTTSNGSKGKSSLAYNNNSKDLKFRVLSMLQQSSNDSSCIVIKDCQPTSTSNSEGNDDNDVEDGEKENGYCSVDEIY